MGKQGYTTFPDIPHMLGMAFTYQVLQIKSFHCRSPATKVEVSSDIWAYYSNTSGVRKGITWFYKYLTCSKPLLKPSQIQNWEKDLQEEFSIRTWQRALKMVMQTSHCVSHWENTIKIMYR